MAAEINKMRDSASSTTRRRHNSFQAGTDRRMDPRHELGQRNNSSKPPMIYCILFHRSRSKRYFISDLIFSRCSKSNQRRKRSKLILRLDTKQEFLYKFIEKVLFRGPDKGSRVRWRTICFSNDIYKRPKRK